MKFNSASLALLGFAASATAAHSNNATPTRPEPALRILGASTFATATSDLLNTHAPSRNNHCKEQEQEEVAKSAIVLRQQEQTQVPTYPHPDLRRRATNVAQVPASASITAIAVFTVNEVAYTVTSLAGDEEVDGRTLTPGGSAQLIGGVDVAENTKGMVVVGGQTLKFEELSVAPSSSSSAPTAVRGSSSSSSGSASASASASAVGGSGQSSDAKPLRRIGAMAIAAVLAAVGGVLAL